MPASGHARAMTLLSPLVGLGGLAADLLFPSECVGCGRDGAAFCPDCVAGHAAEPRPHVPEPAPPHYPPTWTAGEYDGSLRTAVLAYKERGRRDLHRPLGELLAVAVLAAVGTGDGRLRLVPVPSSRAAARRRGGDHLVRMAAVAVTVLRAGGVDAVALPALRLTRRPADSARLDRAQRRANLAGAFAADVVDRTPGAAVSTVVVDDVVTTGTTLAEAAAALRRAGCRHVVGAAVAGTARR